jgi:hypothetical protein
MSSDFIDDLSRDRCVKICRSSADGAPGTEGYNADPKADRAFVDIARITVGSAARELTAGGHGRTDP